MIVVIDINNLNIIHFIINFSISNLASTYAVTTTTTINTITTIIFELIRLIRLNRLIRLIRLIVLVLIMIGNNRFDGIHIHIHLLVLQVVAGPIAIAGRIKRHIHAIFLYIHFVVVVIFVFYPANIINIVMFVGLDLVNVDIT
jgi:hypothetical protein